MAERNVTLAATGRKGWRADEGKEKRMARRRYQNGCIFKRGKNWVLRYREDIRNHDGSIERIHRSVVLGVIANKKEAKREADKRLREINSGNGALSQG